MIRGRPRSELSPGYSLVRKSDHERNCTMGGGTPRATALVTTAAVPVPRGLGRLQRLDAREILGTGIGHVQDVEFFFGKADTTETVGAIGA